MTTVCLVPTGMESANMSRKRDSGGNGSQAPLRLQSQRGKHSRANSSLADFPLGGVATRRGPARGRGCCPVPSGGSGPGRAAPHRQGKGRPEVRWEVGRGGVGGGGGGVGGGGGGVEAPVAEVHRVEGRGGTRRRADVEGGRVMYGAVGWGESTANPPTPFSLLGKTGTVGEWALPLGPIYQSPPPPTHQPGGTIETLTRSHGAH